jgi:hypothetical protein
MQLNEFDDDGFIPLQIDDEFEELLPPLSPFLGAASIDISEAECCELNVEDLIQEGEDADVRDINDLEPDVAEPEVGKLAVRLTDQLMQFRGCCRDCRKHSNSEYADGYELHRGLQAFLNESEDEVLSSCPDVLGLTQIALYDNNLTSSMIAAQKRWVLSGIHLDDPKEAPMHICL